MKLFVVGRYLSEDTDGLIAWAIEGIFDTEEKALEICTDADQFIGPMDLNDDLGRNIEEWPGAYYPIGD
jgi:hypothetical protein